MAREPYMQPGAFKGLMQQARELGINTTGFINDRGSVRLLRRRIDAVQSGSKTQEVFSITLTVAATREADTPIVEFECIAADTDTGRVSRGRLRSNGHPFDQDTVVRRLVRTVTNQLLDQIKDQKGGAWL